MILSAANKPKPRQGGQREKHGHFRVAAGCDDQARERIKEFHPAVSFSLGGMKRAAVLTTPSRTPRLQLRAGFQGRRQQASGASPTTVEGPAGFPRCDRPARHKGHDAGAGRAEGRAPLHDTANRDNATAALAESAGASAYRAGAPLNLGRQA